MRNAGICYACVLIDKVCRYYVTFTKGGWKLNEARQGGSDVKNASWDLPINFINSILGVKVGNLRDGKTAAMKTTAIWWG